MPVRSRRAVLTALATLGLPAAVAPSPAAASSSGESMDFFHNFRTRDARSAGCGGFVSATVFREEGEAFLADARIILNEDTSPECRAWMRLSLTYDDPSGREVHTSTGGGGYALTWQSDGVGGSLVASGQVTFEDCDDNCSVTVTVRAK